MELKQGLGHFLNEEYLDSIVKYLRKNRTEAIRIISAVEYEKKLNDKLEECFVGIWYGIKVMDKEKEVLKITTLLEGDSCFVSEFASERRKKNLLLCTLLSQYLKTALEAQRRLSPFIKKIELKEEINVGERLFNPVGVTTN
ncbi:hypothetical protein COJ92_22435 [Priestia megaterium]|uniref:hypothetical protein n=1 Tax=Priestia megaterium TaxID=1404 RepID=UPI000BF87528|nr:hypothetical protein [Priestia megaterium]PFP15260.1 hypothetical protein COJ92_22435 [Priestia megaterium]